MARLRDVPRVIRTVGPVAFPMRVVQQVFNDNLLTWAAAMAYSWLFALFPFLIFLLSLLPLLPDQVRLNIAGGINNTIETQLPGQAGDTVRQTVGPLLGVARGEGDLLPEPQDEVTLTTGEVIKGNLRIDEATDEFVVIYSDRIGREKIDRADIAEGGIRTEEEVAAEQEDAQVGATVVNNWSGLLSLGLLITLFAASGGMNMTMSALDQCYDIAKPRPFWKQRLIAIGLTLVVGTLVVAVLVLLPITSIVLAFLQGDWLAESWLTVLALNVSRYALALSLLILTLGLVYHFGPSLRRRFHLITPGAVFTLAGWMLTGYAMSTYVTSFGGSENYTKTYGAVGGIIILLLLFYVDALILMIGAELNSEIDFATLGVARPDADATDADETADAEIPDHEKDEEQRELEAELRKATGAEGAGGEGSG